MLCVLMFLCHDTWRSGNKCRSWAHMSPNDGCVLVGYKTITSWWSQIISYLCVLHSIYGVQYRTVHTINTSTDDLVLYHMVWYSTIEYTRHVYHSAYKIVWHIIWCWSWMMCLAWVLSSTYHLPYRVVWYHTIPPTYIIVRPFKIILIVHICLLHTYLSAQYNVGCPYGTIPLYPLHDVSWYCTLTSRLWHYFLL
jgi:hypothetical protein